MIIFAIVNDKANAMIKARNNVESKLTAFEKLLIRYSEKGINSTIAQNTIKEIQYFSDNLVFSFMSVFIIFVV